MAQWYRYPLWPLAQIFKTGVSFKNYAYDQDIFRSAKAQVPVVSVGNLTMGGTGKTPMLIQLIRWAHENKIKVGVVSRGYGGDVSGNEEVELLDRAAQKFGDEPTMIKKMFPHIPVYVGGDRILSIEQMCKKYSVDIILADDAFQHRKLSRDIDIVVIDCLASLSEYFPIPMGRAREPFSEVNRADFVILNRKNLANPETVESLRSYLKDMNYNLDHCIGCDYHVNTLGRLGGGERSRVMDGECVLLVSGVGTPKSVEMVIPTLKIMGHICFPDHHKYEMEDIKNILKLAKKHQVTKILVTQKDAIKLEEFSELQELTWVMDLEPSLEHKVQRLHDAVAALVR